MNQIQNGTAERTQIIPEKFVSYPEFAAKSDDPESQIGADTALGEAREEAEVKRIPGRTAVGAPDRWRARR